MSQNWVNFNWSLSCMWLLATALILLVAPLLYYKQRKGVELTKRFSGELAELIVYIENCHPRRDAVCVGQRKRALFDWFAGHKHFSKIVHRTICNNAWVNLTLLYHDRVSDELRNGTFFS